MRLAVSISTPAATLAATLLLAGAAQAQMMGQMGQGQMMGSQSPASGVYGAGVDGARFPTTQERYAARIVALKQKMVKLTQQDGGQLTDEHKASLQRELDGVNKSFGIKPAHG